jgi:short subunit dehydrogenase-like uncharacterized protein
MSDWMIYGASGYTGGLIAREAKKHGMQPTLAGRSRAKIEALSRELQLPFRSFQLKDRVEVERELEGFRLVLNCAGPFSATAKPMIESCLKKKLHYLDITGEIEVFEFSHGLGEQARQAGVVLCPGVGFDVIPTDCLAAALKAALPDATHLALGFDSRSGISPGTAKTMVEGLAQGGKVRRDGRIVSVPPAYRTRRIDFGDGEKLATTIPWGDVATAWYSTGIPNIEVYIPAPESGVRIMRMAGGLTGALRLPFVQILLKKLIEKFVKGPDEQARDRLQSFVWGEVRNAKGETKTARIVTASGYSLTASGALLAVEQLLNMQVEGGSYTPSRLFGKEMVSKLPGSGAIVVA